jgi:hypothetical protein
VTRGIPALTLLTILGIAILLCAEEPVAGTVRSASGKPLADALVCATTWWCTKTDSDGRYSLDTQYGGKVLRFSRDGYKPVLKAVGGNAPGMDVTLSESDQSAWVIPACRGRSIELGFHFNVVVPKGTKIITTSEVANSILKIRFGPDGSQEWLIIGTGPTWGGGLPAKDELNSLVEIVDRDLRLPSTYDKRDPEGLSLDGVDIRGRLKNGTNWRLTGHAFETLSYRDVSDEAARFFDAIIATLCYQ